MDWLGAGASIVGGLIGAIGQGSTNAANQSMANQAWNNNLYAMMENQRFQERMSNTAYQRSMMDMRNAGLNPILAYSQGGATGATGGGASMTPAIMENSLDSLGKGVSSAAQAAKDAEMSQQVKAQVGLTKAQEAVAAAGVDKVKQETATSAADANRKNAETAVLTEQLKNPAAQRALWAAQGASAASQARLNERALEDNIKYGDSPVGRAGASAERFVQRLGGAIVEKIKAAMDAQAGHSAKGQSDGPPPGATPLEIDIYKAR